jgi:hypothetical protein
MHGVDFTTVGRAFMARLLFETLIPRFIEGWRGVKPRPTRVKRPETR